MYIYIYIYIYIYPMCDNYCYIFWKQFPWWQNKVLQCSETNFKIWLALNSTLLRFGMQLSKCATLQIGYAAAANLWTKSNDPWKLSTFEYFVSIIWLVSVLLCWNFASGYFVKTGFSWLIIWSHLRKKGNIFVIIIISSVDALCLLAEKKELHQWKKSHIGNERKNWKVTCSHKDQLLTVKILIIIATLSSPTIQICWLHVFLKTSCTTFCMLHEISKCCMILQSRYCKLAIIKLLLSKFGKCSHHEFVDAVFWGNLITW